MSFVDVLPGLKRAQPAPRDAGAGRAGDERGDSAADELATGATGKSRLDACPGLVSDCRLMLAYAMKNAFVVTGGLAREIAGLDAALLERGARPISAVNPMLVARLPEPPAGAPSLQETILHVHTALSALIAPTTALTIQISEPPPGRSRIFGGMPLLVKAAVAVAVASALVVVASASMISLSGWPGVIDVLLGGINEFAAAALGASFYVLMRTYPYLTKRAYDPKFNTAYISRFITGVIGGVILSTSVGPTLAEEFPKLPFRQVVGALALLGGYSAEAVEIVLQRLVDVVTAAVRGDGSTAAKSKVAAAQAQKRAKVEALLDEVVEAQGRADADPAQLKAALTRVRAELRSK
jgi:hypothetical protein